MSQIVCRDLSLGYEGRTVSEHIHFSIETGDYLCIVGENGSGKSTLMRALLGLKSPEGGEIIFGDGLSARTIGYLPQQTEVQRDFPASVREVVRSGFAARGGLRPFYSHAERQIAETAMRQVGISALADRPIATLSGGQKQRALLARALCATDRMLLLDEPVAGLDPNATEEMYVMIRELNRHRITVVMITHDVSAVLKYATKVLHMGRAPRFFSCVEEYRNSECFPLREEEGEAHV
jgi:zinc transport system ATP-binding protein